MHMITMSNYEEALGAIRDILLMYVEMAESYEGFGHNGDAAIRFDPLQFIDAETDGKAHYLDLNLLRAGCAIAVLFQYYNRWGEEQGFAKNIYLSRYQTALDEGRFGLFRISKRLFGQRLHGTQCRSTTRGSTRPSSRSIKSM